MLGALFELKLINGSLSNFVALVRGKLKKYPARTFVTTKRLTPYNLIMWSKIFWITVSKLQKDVFSCLHSMFRFRRETASTVYNGYNLWSAEISLVYSKTSKLLLRKGALVSDRFLSMKSFLQSTAPVISTSGLFCLRHTRYLKTVLLLLHWHRQHCRDYSRINNNTKWNQVPPGGPSEGIEVTTSSNTFEAGALSFIRTTWPSHCNRCLFISWTISIGAAVRWLLRLRYSL